MPANDIPQLVRSIEQIVAEMGAAPDAWAMGNVGPRVEAIRRWRQVAREALDGIDALAALQSPPPREADAALWPLVEEWTVAHREWMAPGHPLDGPEYRRYDEARTALLAYRPPSAPAPAVTPTAKPRVESCERCQMKLPEHLGTYAIGVRGGTAWRCAACQPIEGPSGRLLREEVVNRRKRHLAALASPPPPETQP